MKSVVLSLCVASVFAANAAYAETSSSKSFNIVGEQSPIIIKEIQRNTKIPPLRLNALPEIPSFPVGAAIWSDGYAILCKTPMLSMELYAEDHVYEEYILDPALIPELMEQVQRASTEISGFVRPSCMGWPKAMLLTQTSTGDLLTQASVPVSYFTPNAAASDSETSATVAYHKIATAISTTIASGTRKGTIRAKWIYR